MKRTLTLVTILLFAIPVLFAQRYDLHYYLPDDIRTFSENIPSPEKYFGFEVGTQHITYDQLVSYMRELDRVSDRIEILESGRTYENRPMLYMFISTPENIRNRETIREKNLQLAKPELSGKLDLQNMPVVNWLGYSVHGNEATGMNASVIVAYMLAASEDEFVKNILQNNLIILVPSINPDGGNRYANWVNANKNLTSNSDENAREFREPAPSSRSNHYWFDLNRDWLLAQHPESKSRLEIFYKWLPTMVNDYHEQGNATGTFFSPGIRNSTNPLIPDENWLLTKKISAYHSKMLGKIGSMHFSKEDFDDFYTGKGSTLPDLSGAIGILYEQPNPRGVTRERNGITITLAAMVRNQVYCSISALMASTELKTEMLGFQRRFFADRKKMADTDPVKGYLFGSSKDISLSLEFIDMLRAHDIKVHELSKAVTINGKSFEPGSAWVVPAGQQQYSVLKTMFERLTTFRDTTFYDISAWTVPLAMNISYAELRDQVKIAGAEISGTEQIRNGKSLEPVKISNYIYFMEMNDYFSYRLLYSLMDKGIILKSSDKPFSFYADGAEREFSRGTISIPVVEQRMSPQEVNRTINEALNETGNKNLKIFSCEAGQSAGDTDPGSNHFRVISKPSIAILTGKGASYGSAGELWHLLDFRYRIPVSLIDWDSFESMNLDKYNVIVINSALRMTKEATALLSAWAKRDGKTIIATGTAYRTTNELGLSNIETVREKSAGDTTRQGTYEEYLDLRKTTRVNGVIMNAKIDLSSPVAFGLESAEIPLFKNRDIVIAEPKSRYVTPVRYTSNPLMAGYLQTRYSDMFKSTPAILTGKGVVYFSDEPYFRAYWLGSSRLFMNAIFFREFMVREAL